MPLYGYDISNNQGDINNSLVPGDFAIIKATEGVGWTDANCDANYQQAAKAGKLVGVYHFARPDGNDPISEADWFYSQVIGYIGQAIFVLDLEVQPITPQWAKKFLDRFFARSGVRPWIYLNKSTASSSGWNIVWADYALWVAAYGANNRINGYSVPGSIDVPGDWVIAAWQFTSNGFLPNWGDRLDLNVFYGDAIAWRRYAKKAGTPADPAPIPAPLPQPEPTPAPTPPAPPVDPTVPILCPTPAAPAPEPSELDKENNGILKWIKALLSKIFNQG